MSHLPNVMQAFSRLLCYPDENTLQTAELLYVVLQGELPDAARDVSEFGAYLQLHEAWQVEEAFTGTFDVNPACALEVGWHLFGEEYARGLFLVRMRQEMRKYNVSESIELPDHISHVLEVVAAMTDEEAARFVQACVQPAVATMNDALENKDTPYRHVVSSLVKVIERRWGVHKTASQQRVLESRLAQTDPLHAFPVAEAGCSGGCNESCSEPHVVTLDGEKR